MTTMNYITHECLPELHGYQDVHRLKDIQEIVM